jgi:hypothetical protein
MSMAPRVERSTAIEKLKNRNNKLEIQGCISEALYNLSDFISSRPKFSIGCSGKCTCICFEVSL